MAKLRPILGELSGSIAGNTFSHNRGGQYARQRTVPSNPTTVRQLAMRAALASLSQGWAALTDAQRSAWDAWADLHPGTDPLGQAVTLSGHQMYVALNSRLLGNGDAVVADAPTDPAPATLLTATATWTAPTSISVTFTATPLAAGVRLEVWATPPAGVGRDPNENQAAWMVASAAAAASPAAVTSRVSGVAGQVSNLYVRTVGADGQASAFKKIRVTLS